MKETLTKKMVNEKVWNVLKDNFKERNVRVIEMDLPGASSRVLVISVEGMVSLLTLKGIGEAFGNTNPVVEGSTKFSGAVDIYITIEKI